LRIPVPRVWRNRQVNYRMKASTCKACGNVTFPYQPICSRCRGRNVEPVELRGNGRIVSYTVNYQYREGFERQAPQIVALIELEEGPKILGLLTDAEPEEVYEGQRVTAVLRRVSTDSYHGIIYYALKFRPVRDGS
jgi:Predicted nucleic-acid-binding protein containing a Zn-ribbon